MSESTPYNTGLPKYGVNVDRKGDCQISDLQPPHRLVATVWRKGADPEDVTAFQMAAAPLYYDACEWILARLEETGEVLADVRDVSISSLMLTQLMEAHARAKGERP